VPKEDAAARLCALAGLGGKGKLGLHGLLEHYLETADSACDAASIDMEGQWVDENGAIDWEKMQQTFDIMDQALLACAFQLSQRIERIVMPD